MRVIAGTFKGRRLSAPSWEGLRPTSDKLRETLFNILGASIVDARVMDGFAGTGALGIEALSRGAAHVTFVERDRRAASLIAENVARCGAGEGAYAIIRGDVGEAVLRLPPRGFDIILLDPPYQSAPVRARRANASEAALDLAALAPLMTDEGVLVLEHASRAGAPEAAGSLVRVRNVRSGDSALAFYRTGSSRGGRV